MPAPLAAWAAKKGTEAAVEAGASLARRIVPKVAGGLTTVMLLAVMGVGIGGGSRAGACGPNAPVPSSADLDPATLGAVNALKADYEQAGAAKDVSWALLAGIDYREDGNDPGASALSGEPLGTANPDNPSVVTTTKLDSLVQAADHVKAMASSVYGVTLTAASSGVDVQNALVAYNRGYSYKQAGAPADTSPYVMNQYDEAHRDMVFPSLAGETLAGMTEHRPGAFTVFSRLGGPSTSTTGCAGLSDSNIVAIAQQQLGLAEQPKGCNCGPEIAKFLGSSSSEAWCADFISWVYMTAGHPFTGGADGGWRQASAFGLRDWLTQTGTYHGRGDGDPPQPGDVITFVGDGSGHTGIVEKLDGSTLSTIEGNSSDQVIRRTYEDYTSRSEIIGWGRPQVVSPGAIALGRTPASGHRLAA